MADKLNPAAKTSALRLLFWACWAGTVLFFLITPYPEFVGRDFNHFGYSFVSGMVVTLCFTSAACVRYQPRLAMLGALTLGMPFLIILIFVLGQITFGKT